MSNLTAFLDCGHRCHCKKSLSRHMPFKLTLVSFLLNCYLINQRYFSVCFCQQSTASIVWMTWKAHCNFLAIFCNVLVGNNMYSTVQKWVDSPLRVSILDLIHDFRFLREYRIENKLLRIASRIESLACFKHVLQIINLGFLSSVDQLLPYYSIYSPAWCTFLRVFCM